RPQGPSLSPHHFTALWGRSPSTLARASSEVVLDIGAQKHLVDHAPLSPLPRLCRRRASSPLARLGAGPGVRQERRAVRPFPLGEGEELCCLPPPIWAAS